MSIKEQALNSAAGVIPKDTSRTITQDELELCRLGMMVARLQLKAMSAVATAVEHTVEADGFAYLERQFEELSKQIHNGEIRGA